jgi:hypothetical protein
LKVFIHKKWGRKKSKNCQIHICDFHCGAKHIEGWLNICSLFLVYSQSLLNLLHLPMNDHHFSYKQKFLEMTLVLTAMYNWKFTRIPMDHGIPQRRGPRMRQYLSFIFLMYPVKNRSYREVRRWLPGRIWMYHSTMANSTFQCQRINSFWRSHVKNWTL